MRIARFTCCAFLLTAPLLGEMAFLDSVMSKDEQKKTGVDTLTPRQKIELEIWLNKNFQLRQVATTTQAKEQPLFLSINIDNGQKIELTDGSIWEVDPEDYPTSQIWISPIPIKVVPSNNTDYPFLLVNKTTGVSIKVRKTEAQPSPTP